MKKSIEETINRLTTGYAYKGFEYKKPLIERDLQTLAENKCFIPGNTISHLLSKNFLTDEDKFYKAEFVQEEDNYHIDVWGYRFIEDGAKLEMYKETIIEGNGQIGTLDNKVSITSRNNPILPFNYTLEECIKMCENHHIESSLTIGVKDTDFDDIYEENFSVNNSALAVYLFDNIFYKEIEKHVLAAEPWEYDNDVYLSYADRLKCFKDANIFFAMDGDTVEDVSLTYIETDKFSDTFYLEDVRNEVPILPALNKEIIRVFNDLKDKNNYISFIEDKINKTCAMEEAQEKEALEYESQIEYYESHNDGDYDSYC